jgi:DNA-binding response OmpR family regulator
MTYTHTAPANPVRPVVFVVDDDPTTLELLCEIARDAGWLAKGFTRLDELRRSLDVGTPTLLILDDDLPDGRGGDLARELHGDDRMADVPILVCTAAHPMRQAEIGAWAPVVSKPFDLSQIDAFLGAAADRNRGSDRYGQRAG